MDPSSREGGGLIAVRRGALGDTVLFLPVLQAFVRAFPGESLCFAGNGDYLEAPRLWAGAGELRSVEGWPPMRELYSGKGPPGPLPNSWRRACCVLLEWDRTGPWGPVRLFDPRPAAGVQEPISLQLLRRTGLLEHAPWPPEALAWDRKPRQVLLHPGAGSPAKRWPLEAFLRLGRELIGSGYAVVFLLGPVEREQMPSAAYLEGAGLEVRSCHQLGELLACLCEAALWVGNDSGPTHLAAALGIPTLALFGPTDPEVWAPPWPAAQVLRAESLMSLSVGSVLGRARDLV